MALEFHDVGHIILESKMTYYLRLRYKEILFWVISRVPRARAKDQSYNTVSI